MVIDCNRRAVLRFYARARAAAAVGKFLSLSLSLAARHLCLRYITFSKKLMRTINSIS